MPLYEIHHCVPLSQEQKDALADFITTLHATTFVTPKLFVNIVFDKPASVGGIYAAGKFRGQVIPNHIRATVRVAPSRTKEMFDEVAVKIQRYWDAVVNNAALGATLSFGNLSEQQEKQLKRLRGIVFVPMVAALEGGIAAPGPGDEGTWLKDNMAYFEEQANVHGDHEIRDMLEEIKEREDLRALIK